MSLKGNQYESGDFIDLLYALKDNTLRAANVADLAIVTSITEDRKANCKLLNDQNTKLLAQISENLLLKKDDVVLVIYTNSDYRGNLSRYKAKQPLITEEKNAKNHLISYAIVTNLIYRRG